MTASATQRARSAKVVEPPEDGFDADGLPGAADTAGSIRSLWYLCPLVVTWAIVVGALAVAAPVFAAWLSSSAWEQGVAGPLRLSVLGWVVIHDVPVRVDGASYSLMPWGLAVVPFALLWLGGRWAGRVSQIIEVRATLALVGWTAALYAATIGIATWVVSAPDLRLSAPRAFCTALTLAFAAIALGVYRGTLAGERLRREVPDVARVVLGASTCAVVALLAMGSALAAAGLVRNFSAALALSESLQAGPVGGLVLLVLGLGYVPVIATWAVAYAVGAGVSLGPDALAAPFNAVASSTQLPPFPLLAAIPSRSLEWPMLPMAIGPLAGLLLGWYVARSAPRSVAQRMALAVASAALAGVGMAVMSVLARGSLGQDRMTDLGPNPPAMAMAVIGLLLVGAIPAALILRPRRRPGSATGSGTSTEGSAP